MHRIAQQGPGLPNQPIAPKGRPSILLVEDEVLVALDLSQQLASVGFEVLGPAATVTGAFSLLNENGCDAAVLDVNLGNETSEPIACRLMAEGVPMLVLSGYTRSQHPSVFHGLPCLGKPIAFRTLVGELRKLLRQS